MRRISIGSEIREMRDKNSDDSIFLGDTMQFTKNRVEVNHMLEDVCREYFIKSIIFEWQSFRNIRNYIDTRKLVHIQIDVSFSDILSTPQIQSFHMQCKR